MLNYSRRRIYSSSSIFFHLDSLKKLQLIPTNLLVSSRTLTVGTIDAPAGDYDPLYADVPRPPRNKSERKPYPTPMSVLIQRAKQEKEARKAQPVKLLEEPPDNGLLVPELVPVAHQVYRARELILLGLAKLVNVIPVLRCRDCYEVHIGRVGHEIRTCTGPQSGLRSATHVWCKGRITDVIYFPKCFHLDDRVGKPRILHIETDEVKRLPAVVELCIQAGVNLKSHPTKRRIRPVYSIEGRISDFEPETNIEIVSEDTVIDSSIDLSLTEELTIKEVSILTLDSWFEMISGLKKIMERYKVHTCGYCPEVQVGPKGHKVRNCKAAKHQTRDGMHAWQESTLFDLVGPKYVWHVADVSGPPLANDLKRYFGKAPAVVEMCVQAGAPIPDEYRSMMRLDVVPPSLDERDLVA